MRKRRAFLTLGFGLVLASAGRYVDAADPSISAEGDLHTGTSTGGWICGPLAQARYAGGGAQVHYVNRAKGDEHSMAIAADVAGSAEHETEELKSDACEGQPQPCTLNDLPPSRWLLSGRARVGVELDWIGIMAGATTNQWWQNHGDKDPTLYVLPDAFLRFGQRSDGWRTHLGFGAPILAQLRRPGFYLGPGFGVNGWQADLFFAVARGGPASFDRIFIERLDAGMSAPITSTLGVRATTSLSNRPGNLDGFDGALSVGVTAQF